MFSIIMPYYKNLDVISRSVNSVLRQNINDFELIIIDDGSEDDVCSVIDKFNDKRIRLITQSNSGVSRARNNAIHNSNGEWICFLDSDDEWLPDHLETIVSMQKMYSNSLFYVTSHRRMGNRIVNSCKTIPVSYDEIFIVDDLLAFLMKYSGILHTNSICINKMLLKKCGCFAENVNRGEDTDLWYRCALYTSVVISKKVTSVYHRDSSRLTKEKDFNFNWIFLKREEELTECEEIPLKKRYSLKLFCQKYQISACKRFLAQGKKENAKEILNLLNNNLCSELKANYMLLKIICWFPNTFVRNFLKIIYQKKTSRY